MGSLNRRISLLYFTEEAADSGSYKCTCGKRIIQKKGTGWSNLFNHIKAQHPEWKDRANQGMQTLQFPKKEPISVTSSVENMYGWIDWVVGDLRPFSFVEEERTRRYTNLKPVCSKTLKSKMSLLTEEVERKITAMLPEQFALIFDGWSKSSTHFVALFASYPDRNENGYSTVLLAFSPLQDETCFTAQAHLEFISWVLENVYSKSMSNVVALIGDNCETNKCLANLCKLPLIGCASHRLQLAVTKYLQEYSYEPILKKVYTIMTKLKKIEAGWRVEEVH